MPFKIVQTIEKGRAVLTVVPHGWETGGYLSRPRKREIKLQRIENSRPQADWRTIHCIVKRSNLPSFTQAEALINDVNNLSDTDTDNDKTAMKRNRTKTSTSTYKVNLEPYFDERAGENMAWQSQPVQQIKEEFIVVSEENNSLSPLPHKKNETDDEGLNFLLQKIDVVTKDVKTLCTGCRTITDNQQALFQNQHTILEKLTEMQAQFDEFIKQSRTPTKYDETPDVKQVSNLTELQELELSLRDPDFKARLRNKIEVVCSKGKHRGTNNAYALIDVLFHRSFLCLCSWAGGSRTEKAKICLKSFTNILDLFFSVIHESDPEFNKPDCEKFLKTVLKNSYQRYTSKQIRTSTTRRRQKIKKVTTESPSELFTSSRRTSQENNSNQNSDESEDESEVGYLL